MVVLATRIHGSQQPKILFWLLASKKRCWQPMGIIISDHSWLPQNLLVTKKNSVASWLLKKVPKKPAPKVLSSCGTLYWFHFILLMFWDISKDTNIWLTASQFHMMNGDSFSSSVEKSPMWNETVVLGDRLYIDLCHFDLSYLWYIKSG